jgi:hypothetical protein
VSKNTKVGKSVWLSADTKLSRKKLAKNNWKGTRKKLKAKT